jgi:hypothetical protein
MPASTRAIRTPNRRPERTTEIADARRFSGARSAARGMRICGVTVRAPTRKDMVSKTTRELVTARPMVRHVERKTMARMRERRRRR